MTPEQFCYWLQGAFETADEGRGLSGFDHIVRDHLNTVFVKKTPDYSSITKVPYIGPSSSAIQGITLPDYGTTFIC